MSITNPGAPKSFHEQVKEDKELLKPKEVKEPDRSIAGLNNPAVFGKWNTNFNKNCL